MSFVEPGVERRQGTGERAALAETFTANSAVCAPLECSAVSPSNTLIVDFSDVREDGVFVDADSWHDRAPDWWQKFYGSPYVYPQTIDGLSQSTDGTWRIRGVVQDWSGFGLWFGACSVDMSAYSGFSFDISGDVGPSGRLKLFVNTGPNAEPEACRLGVGSCDSERQTCRQPSISFEVAAASPGSVSIMFADLVDGAPLPNPDSSDILQFHFAFDWTDYQEMRSEPYSVDVALDDFRLVP